MGGNKGNGAAAESAPAGGAVPLAERQPDGIYQFDRFGQEQRLVARVVGAEVDEAGQVIRFAEVYQSDEWVLADECEYQKYRLLVKKIGYASRLDKTAPHKGRVLREVTAAVLGRREP